MIIETAVAALLPAATDGVRALINRVTGGSGAKPANVEEAIRLADSQVERMKALAEIDKPADNVSPWVNNIRALQRPVALAVVVLAYTGSLYIAMPTDQAASIAELASIAVGYVFGERAYMYFKKS